MVFMPIIQITKLVLNSFFKKNKGGTNEGHF